MKYFAIVTVLVLIITIICVGGIYLTANVVVEAAGVTALEATAQPQRFAELKEQQRLGAVVGTAYLAPGDLGDAENYQFYTYTLRLRNDSTVPAELIEVQISPMAGDVMLIDAASSDVLPAKGTLDVTATLMTAANMHAVREVTVTYYMWGVPFTTKVTVR